MSRDVLVIGDDRRVLVATIMALRQIGVAAVPIPWPLGQPSAEAPSAEEAEEPTLAEMLARALAQERESGDGLGGLTCHLRPEVLELLGLLNLP